jgi:uncharacterized protein (DUF1697 family)
MIYVALLRGINVGGKAKVEMIRLKNCFEVLGCKNVSTYINSGNVIFKDEREEEELVTLIESAIEESFGVRVPVLLRNFEQVRALYGAIPVDWTNDKLQKTDILFLWRVIDDKDILGKVIITPGLENVLYVEGALVWNVARKDAARGGAIKLIKTEFYRNMTVRNVNTVRRLYVLMKSL